MFTLSGAHTVLLNYTPLPQALDENNATRGLSKYELGQFTVVTTLSSAPKDAVCSVCLEDHAMGDTARQLWVGSSSARCVLTHKPQRRSGAFRASTRSTNGASTTGCNRAARAQSASSRWTQESEGGHYNVKKHFISSEAPPCTDRVDLRALQKACCSNGDFEMSRKVYITPL